MFRQNDGKIRIEGQTAQIPDSIYSIHRLPSLTRREKEKLERKQRYESVAFPKKKSTKQRIQNTTSMKRIMYLGKQSSPMDIYKHGYTKILSNSRSSLDLSTTKMLDAHRNLITKKAIMDQGKKASNLFNVEKKTKVIHPEDIPSRNNTKTEQLGTQAGNINEGYTKTRSVSPRESVEIEEIATKGPVWNGLEKILKDSGRSPPLEGSKTYRSTGSMRDLFFCGGNLYTDKNVPMALTSKSIIKVPQLPPKPKEGDGETKLKYMSRIFPEETLKHIGNEFTKIPKIADEFYLPINSSNYTHQISSVNSENNKMLDKLLTLYDRDYLELRRTRLEEQIKAKKTVMLLIDKEQTVVTNKRLLNRQIDEMKIITEPEKNNKSGSLNINDLYKQFHEQINKLTHSNQREQFELYVKLYHIRNQDVRLAKDIFEKNINKDTEDKLDAHSIPNIQYKIANFINQMNRKNMQSVDEFFENEAFDPPKDKNANLLNRLQTDSNSSTTSSLQRKYFNLIKAGHLDEVKKLLKKYPYLLTSTDNTAASGLHWACIRGHTHIVEYFIRMGMDLEAEDISERSPKKIAETFGHTKVIKLLREALP